MATTVYELMAKLGIDTSNYEKGLSKAKSAGSAIGEGLQSAAKIGIKAIGAATAAVGAFAAASVKTGAEFDKSMSQVAATMGKTMAEMENETGSVMLTLNGETKEFTGTLREFAQEMGRNTAFSATQAADALNYMALAGYKTQESMEMLPNVLNLAAAGNFDLARASDMVTDTQTAFGITAERTTQMVDEMAKAASTGNTSVEQLGEAFLVVGGLAQELNGGFVTLADGTKAEVDGIQEMEIAMTAMANAGIKGSEAGTHMRNMILKLSKPTSDGAKALEAMGVNVFDAEGKMRSLADVFGDLSNKMGEMTQEQKIKTISNLFNTRDLASAEALLNAVNQDWDEIGEAILNAEGAAQQMADTQLDNLAGDVTLFKSALEGAQIAISDVLAPSLREFVQFGTSGLSQLTSAFQEGGLSGAMETFGTILADGLNMIIEKLPSFVDAGMQLLGALGQGLLDNLPMIIDVAIEIVEQLVNGLISALPSIVKGAMELISGLAMGLAKAVPDLIPTIVEVVMNIAEFLIDNIDMLIDAGVELIIGLAMGLVDAIPVLMDKVPVIISRLVEALVRNLPKLVEGGVRFIIALADGLIQGIPRLVLAIPEIIFALASGIANGVVDIMEVGMDLVDGLWQGIKNSWNHLVENAKNLGKNLVDTFKNILKIGSPSKVFRDQIGKWIPEGIAVGIEANSDSVTSAIDDLTKESVDLSDSLFSSGLSLDTNKMPVSQTSASEGLMSNIEDILLRYLPELLERKLYLDTGELVGATIGAYDTALGTISDRSGRR